MSLASYGNDVVNLMTVQNGSNYALADRYAELVNRTGQLITVPDIASHISSMSAMDYNDFKYRSVIGAVFTQDVILAMFSNEPYHSIPITLTNIYNAVIRGKDPSAPELVFVNHPMPIRLSDEDRKIESMSNYYLIAFLVSMGALSCSSDQSEFYVPERESGALNVQFIAGISPVLYWIFSLIADLIVYGLSVGTVILVAGLSNTSTELWEFYQILFLFGFAALPFGYLRARRFKKAADLGSDLRKFGYFGMLAYVLITGAIMLGKVDKKYVEVFYMILPHINLFDGVLKYTMGISGLGSFDDLWKNKVVFIASGTFYFVLVILHEIHALDWLYGMCQRKGSTEIVNDRRVDEDVVKEAEKVDRMTPGEISSQLMVAKHLQKSFGRFTAVKDSTFTLER